MTLALVTVGSGLAAAIVAFVMGRDTIAVFSCAVSLTVVYWADWQRSTWFGSNTAT